MKSVGRGIHAMQTEITVGRLKETVDALEGMQRSGNFQKIEDVLPLAIEVIRQRLEDTESLLSGTKFHAPKWIGSLFIRIHNGDRPLTAVERGLFAEEVSKLSVEDFKTAGAAQYEYETLYLDREEIVRMVFALKRYFGVL